MDCLSSYDEEEGKMILGIPDIPDETFRILEERAALKQISVEDEIREIIEQAAQGYEEDDQESAAGGFSLGNI
jgi:plasmid stability protein